MGAFFFLSQFLQSVQGYTPLEAGVRLIPMAAVSFISAALSAQVANRIGTKITVALGILIAAAGFFYFYRVAAVDISYGNIVLPMCMTSLGIGMTMSPATNSVMGSVPVGQSGIGSALNNTTRQIGAALGVAILGTIMNATYLAKINAVEWPAQLPAQAIEAIRNSVQGAHIVAQSMPSPQLSELIVNQSNQAFTYGSSYALLGAAFVLVVTSIITFIILPSKVQPSQEV